MLGSSRETLRFQFLRKDETKDVATKGYLESSLKSQLNLEKSEPIASSGTIPADFY